MSTSLADYHSNPVKYGAILKQYAKEGSFSQASHARHIGSTYDTVGNNYAGKVHNFSFDFVLKSCILFGVPLDVFALLLLQDEDIDFRDQLLALCSRPHGGAEVTPVTDISAAVVEAVVPDTVAAVASAIAAVPDAEVAPAPATGSVPSPQDCASAVLARADQDHADIVAHLAESRRLIIEQHDKEVAVLRAEIERQDALIRTLLDRLVK